MCLARVKMPILKMGFAVRFISITEESFMKYASFSREKVEKY